MAETIEALFSPDYLIEVIDGHSEPREYSPLQFLAYLWLNSPVEVLGEGEGEKRVGISLRHLKDREPGKVLMAGEVPPKLLYFREDFRDYFRDCTEAMTPEHFTEWLQRQLERYESVTVEKLLEFVQHSVFR